MAKKGAPAIVDASRQEAANFLARCPFCSVRVRLPMRARGASLPCPQCGCFFTAAIDEAGDGGKP
jgi:hypothetical protein